MLDKSPNFSRNTGWCSAADSQFAIDYNCNIYPCSELISEDFVVTNLSKINYWGELEAYFKKFRERTGFGTAVADFFEQCNICPLKLLCKGGCRVEDMLNGVDFYKAKYPYKKCEIYNELFELILWEIGFNNMQVSASEEVLYGKGVMELVKEYNQINTK